MSIALLDVNVLLALAWPDNSAHEAAHAWFVRHGTDLWATCPITQLGFVRLSADPGYSSQSVVPREAVALLHDLLAHPRHVFWSADFSIDEDASAFERLTGHKQFTNAYLLALARAHGGCLVTFDRGLRALAQPGDEPGTLLILEA